jgi:hypothetical protein
MRRQNLIESGRRFRISYRSARFQHQQSQNLRNLNIKRNLTMYHTSILLNYQPKGLAGTPIEWGFKSLGPVQ